MRYFHNFTWIDCPHSASSCRWGSMLLPSDRFPVPGDQDLQKDHTREQRDLANHCALSLVPAEGGHGWPEECTLTWRFYDSDGLKTEEVIAVAHSKPAAKVGMMSNDVKWLVKWQNDVGCSELDHHFCHNLLMPTCSLEALAHEQMLIQQGHIPRFSEEQAKQRQEIQLALDEQRIQEHHCKLSRHGTDIRILHPQSQ